MTVRLPDRLDLIATAPEGIRKLRGLILELAVRGKLVAQDPNDEPASELLKRIAKERARLEAEGICKKAKPLPLPLMGQDEQPFELPDGWEWSRIGELSSVIRGVSYDKSQASESQLPGYLPLLRGHNINQRLNFDDLVLVPKTIISNDQFIRRGDIVIAMSSGSAHLVGKAAQAEDDFQFGFGAFCGLIRAHCMELHRYFGFFFQTPLYRNRVAGHGKGIGINNLQKGSLLALECPVPPLAEQHRIVAKVDELMALCDRLEAEQTDAGAAHARLVDTLLGTLTQSADAAELAANWQRLAEHFDSLFTTEASLDALKQTILQLAVMGKLVPQDLNDEPASELLRRIAEERTRLEAEGICKKSKPMPPTGEDEQPFTLPQSWRWSRLGSLCSKITDGEHATPSRSSTGHYLLSARNVTNEGILLGNVDLVPPEEFERIRKRCDPGIGDVLISCSGSVGRVALVDRDDTYSMVRSAAMIRPISLGITPDFAARCLRSPVVQSEMVSKSRQSAQANLFLGAISSLVIPLPPLAEQHRIVAKVDELLALVDRLKAGLAESRAQQERLAATLIESALQAA